jgi:uncharacterized membrane protein
MINLVDSLKLYGIGFLVFLAIDAVWLGLIARQFYGKYLGHLLSPTPNFIAAGIFYLLFIISILVFAVIPGLNQNSVIKAVMLGALFGLITYATYDLTNLATLKDWPLLVTVVDLIWGTVLSASVAGITTAIAQKIL